MTDPLPNPPPFRGKGAAPQSLTTFILRPYTEADQEPSIALWLATWKLAYPSIDFDARVDWWRKRWREELMPHAQVIVGDCNGAMAGFVTIDGSGYLDQLVVSPTHQGSQLATMLVDEAKRLSPNGVMLKVNADNVRAIRFYVRNGFVDVGEDFNPGSNRPVRKMAWVPDTSSA
jgi:putative acetyltransferase